jgi:hypothetical protein
LQEMLRLQSWKRRSGYTRQILSIGFEISIPRIRVSQSEISRVVETVSKKGGVKAGYNVWRRWTGCGGGMQAGRIVAVKNASNYDNNSVQNQRVMRPQRGPEHRKGSRHLKRIIFRSTSRNNLSRLRMGRKNQFFYVILLTLIDCWRLCLIVPQPSKESALAEQMCLMLAYN